MNNLATLHTIAVIAFLVATAAAAYLMLAHQ